MARNRELIERVEKLEAEVAELRKLLTAKTAPKPASTKTKTF